MRSTLPCSGEGRVGVPYSPPWFRTVHMITKSRGSTCLLYPIPVLQLPGTAWQDLPSYVGTPMSGARPPGERSGQVALR